MRGCWVWVFCVGRCSCSCEDHSFIWVIRMEPMIIVIYGRIIKKMQEVSVQAQYQWCYYFYLMSKYRKYVLKSFPSKNFPEDLSCFDLIEADYEDLKLVEGQVLVRVIWISSDPLLRTWISGAKSYLDPVGPGSPIPGFGIGRVIKVSKKKGKKTMMETNDWTVGMLQWSQFMKCDYDLIQRLPLDLGAEMFKFLTIYGPTGFTSFWSIKREIEPFQIMDTRTRAPKTKESMNIVISSVAGGIGLTVTEYLSKMGYKRIFGIAGTDQKCKVAMSLGCKACLNYKNFYDKETIRSKQFQKAIRGMMDGQQCDIYYQNVGEDMLSSMLNVMADHSKIIMCGATATYNNWGMKEGIKNFQNVVSKRIQLKGILYFDENFNERIKVFMEMGALSMDGYDVMVHGIENLPVTYRRMIHGEFIGKPVVQLWEDPCIAEPEEEKA